MDELFSDVWGTGRSRRRPSGFTPRLDVYYAGAEEPKAVVKVDLPGVPPDSINLEIAGRDLIISGERPLAGSEGRVYQQIETETGPFRLAVGQERSIRLVNDVLSGERTLVMVAARDPELDEPGPDDLYEVGVVGVVARMMKVPDGSLRILVQGTERVRLDEFVAERPYLV